jgi:hypothetical protein
VQTNNQTTENAMSAASVPAGTGKVADAPKGPTTAFLLEHFQSEVTATRTAFHNSLTGGISAVCHGATLAWQGAAQGASKEQIAFLLLGKAKPEEDGKTGKDTAEGKIYRQSKRLAFYWRQFGYPAGFREANSFASAVDASRAWLVSHDIRSIDGLHAFLSGAMVKPKAEKPLPERMVKALGNAVNDGRFGGTDAAQLGAGLVGVIGKDNVEAFCAAVVAATESLRIRMREDAAKAMESAPATGTEG